MIAYVAMKESLQLPRNRLDFIATKLNVSSPWPTPTENAKPKAPTAVQIDLLRETLQAVLEVAAPDHQDRLKQLRDDLVEALRTAEESEAVATMLSTCNEMHSEISRAQLTAGAGSLARMAQQLVGDLGNLIDRVEREFKVEWSAHSETDGDEE